MRAVTALKQHEVGRKREVKWIGLLAAKQDVLAAGSESKVNEARVSIIDVAWVPVELLARGRWVRALCSQLLGIASLHGRLRLRHILLTLTSSRIRDDVAR